ncbi:hypothetical protein [Oceanospirillum phage vB_OliS_GJ44]|nr:hypothetical protein [Oceanospirillum phage vB_OliS_GJ44]
MKELNAKAISDYLGQYFTGAAYAEGVVSACMAMANGESGYRALKHGIAKAREFELRAA